MFSKKATKIDKIFTMDLTFTRERQINGEDFLNFCGLLRKHELYEKLWVSLKPHKYKHSNANVQINRELHKEAWMCTYRKLRMSKQDSISTQKPIFSRLSELSPGLFYWSKFLLLISQQFSSAYSMTSLSEHSDAQPTV